MEEIKKFNQEIQQLLFEVQPKLQQYLVSNENKCMKQNENNMEKFAQCMDKLTTNTENLEKEFSFKITGMNLQTQQCFKQAADKKQRQECQNKFRPLAQKLISEFAQNFQ